MSFTQHKTHLFIFACSLFLAMACDSGDIEEQEYIYSSRGRTVKMTATVSGVASWNGKYTIALAGFPENDDYSVMQRLMPSEYSDHAPVTLLLTNIPAEVQTVELVVANRLRRRLLSFGSISLADYPQSQDTIYMDLGVIDIGLFSTLQSQVFDKACILCHGGNGGAGAARLNLTSGKAYGQLVDVSSTRKEGAVRVVSGNAEASLLHHLFNEGGEDILGTNHVEIINSQFKDNTDDIRSLIDDWIENLRFH